MKNLISRFFFLVLVVFCIANVPVAPAFGATTLHGNHLASFSLDGKIQNRLSGTTYNTGSVTYPTGKINQGLVATTTPSISNTSLGITTADGAVTVAFWYKWNGTYQISVPGFSTYFCDFDASGYFGFTTTDGDTEQFYCSNPFTAGVWTHVVLVYNYRSIASNKLYINGVERTLQQYGSSTRNRQVWGTNFMFVPVGSSGSAIDDIQVWDRAITSSEVNYLYTAYLQNNPTMTVNGNSAAGSINLSWTMNDSAHDYHYNVYKKIETGAFVKNQTNVTTTSFNDTTCPDNESPDAPTGISQDYSGSTISSMNDHVTWTEPADNGTLYTFYCDATEDVTGIVYTSTNYTCTQTSGIRYYYIVGISPNQFTTAACDLKFVNSDEFSSGTSYGVYAEDYVGNDSSITTFYANPPPFIIQSASTTTIDFGSVSPLTSDYPINSAASINIEANYYTDITARGTGSFVGSNPSNTIPIGALSLRFRDFTELLPMSTLDATLKNWAIEKPHYDANDGLLDKYHVLNSQTGVYNYGLSKSSFVLDVNFKSSWNYAADNYSANVIITISPGKMN